MKRSILISLWLVFAVSQASSRTWYVVPDQSGDAPTIQAAIDSASSGDVIELADGVFLGPGNRDLLVQNKVLTIKSTSNDSTACVIDCQKDVSGTGRALTVEADGIQIKGMSIINAANDGIHNIGFGSLTLTNCTVSNAGQNGLKAEWGYVVIDSCTFSYNPTRGLSADFLSSQGNHSLFHHNGVGLYFSSLDDGLNYSECTFSDNETGVVANNLEPESLLGPRRDEMGNGFVDCHFLNNDRGGYLDGFSLSFNHCEFSDNILGGVFFPEYSYSLGKFSDCNFVGNGGTGIDLGWGSLTIQDSWVQDNTGDGISTGFNCTVSLINTVVTHNDSTGLLVREGIPDGAPREISVDSSTISHNGTGVDINEDGPANTNFQNSIISFNSGEGLVTEGALFNCVNVFGNGPDIRPDDWVEGEGGNFSADPLFCDPANFDFNLASNSPCSPDGPCGAIGALPAHYCAPIYLSRNFVTQIDDSGTGSGAAWGDFNQDEYPDLYLTLSDGGNLLFRNDGGLMFSDVSQPPIDDPGEGASGYWGDFNNDGLSDLYLAQGGAVAPNALFVNVGGGIFNTLEMGPQAHVGISSGASWVDIDRDGFLDIFVSQSGSSDILLRNLGGTGFADVTPTSLAYAGDSRTPAWADYDADGDPDLYLVVADGPNMLLRNDSGQFTQVAATGLEDAGPGQGAAWADYDNDGDLDLFLTNWGESQHLFRNDEGDSFQEVLGLPLDGFMNGQGVDWGDYDNDGDLDIFLAGRGSVNLLLRNEGADAFTRIEESALADSAESVAVTWVDPDRDGDVDLYVVNDNDPNRFFENIHDNGNHWLQVRVKGSASNASGIHARVQVVSGGMTQLREITAGSGYLSQTPNLAVFGIGSSAIIDTLKVQWPRMWVSGYRDTIITSISPDTLLVIEEALPFYWGSEVSINTSPDSVSTPWEIQGPEGVFLTGDSDTTFMNLPPGDYTVTWLPGVGWAPPEVQMISQYLPPGGAIDFSGSYGTEPYLAAIDDYENDQGGRVRLIWNRCAFDSPGAAHQISGYSIYRYIYEPGNLEKVFNRTENRPGWDFIANIPAYFADTYEVVVPTLCDFSQDAGICWSKFVISARTPDHNIFFDSLPDSGYSIDNLAPSVPTSFHREAGPVLAWDEPVDEDFRYFILFGSFLDVLDDTALTIGSTAETSMSILGHSYPYFHLVATDFAGNLSDAASLAFPSTVPGQAPTRFFLHPNYPNPFNPVTTIIFDIPLSSSTTLSVFDVSGRKVRNILTRESLPAGQHRLEWDGRDESGQVVGAGVYFYRLNAGEYCDTKRMSLIK